MPLFEYLHVDHDDHLCNIILQGTTIEEFKKLVKDAKFIITICGRAAAKKKNLCASVPL